MGGGVRDRLLSFRSLAAFGGFALVVAMAVASRREAERQTKRLVRQPLRVLSRRRRWP